MSRMPNEGMSSIHGPEWTIVPGRRWEGVIRTVEPRKRKLFLLSELLVSREDPVNVGIGCAQIHIFQEERQPRSWFALWSSA